MNPRPDRILVIHLAGIGDLLMGRAALAALRRTFPDSRIALLTWAKSGDVARLLPSVDDRYVLKEACSWRALRQNVALILALRARRFALAINLYQAYRWVGVLKLAGLLRLIAPGQTVGRDTDGRGWCFDVKVPDRSEDERHEVERQLAVTDHLGCARPDAAGSLQLDPDDERALETWLQRHGVHPGEALMGLHPGGTRVSHRWPWQAVAAVARRLESRSSVRWVITGNRQERALAARIAAHLRAPIIAAGELSLGQTACLLCRCRLFLTNDSGPMHLAASLSVPLVAVAGPMDPHRYGPYPLNRPGQRILHAAGCAPCYRMRCRGHQALEAIPVDAVLQAAESVLAGQPPSGLQEVSPRIRILHVHTLPVISGSGLNTFLSMDGMSKDRYEVELACAAHSGPSGAASRAEARDAGGESLSDLVEQHGMIVHRLTHMVWPIHPLQDLLVVAELIRLMRRRRYAIVHTHNSKAGFVGRLAARLAGVPVVIHTVHGFAFHPYECWWRRALYRWLERLAARWCDRLILISQPLIEWAAQERIAPREKMVKIYSGIDLKAFRQPIDRARLRAALGFQDHEFVVGEVAKLWRGKGHEVLFRAAASLTDRLPSLRLLIVGEGGLRPFLTRLAEDLGIRERVVFTGFRQDIPALTQVVDVAVLPTQFEGMGRAVLEAQAAGRPVIASRVGGVPDLIVDGQTGLLVDAGNVDQLAEAIWRLFQHPEQRRQLGEAAQCAVDERFDAATMARQIVQVYEGILAQKGHQNP